MHWIQHPLGDSSTHRHAGDGSPDQDARDVAAYLNTLKHSGVIERWPRKLRLPSRPAPARATATGS